MSVINKMLRDLDQRQAKPSAPMSTGATAIGWPALHSTGATGAHRFVPWVLLALGVALLCAGAAWWWWPSHAVPPVVAAPSAPVAPVAATVSQSPAPQVAIAPGAATKPEVVAKAAPAAPPAAPVVAATRTREPPATLGLRMDNSLSLRKSAERSAMPERAASARPDAPTPTGAGGNDALERAQALWNTGSRDAAIDLLQDAVVVAERQGAGGSYPQGNPALLPLVRELTRMQLADARHAPVWELLSRLEPQLGHTPDLWAIRGNAAQRLGRHQDSVHAYLVALQSRPNEQRWLLGAAVSLAALGQSTSAADMADKARAVGVVSPEVLAYLRQQGVPLKDK